MNLIFKTLTGSRLYGIHDKTSDYDYKGIYISPLIHYLGFVKAPNFKRSNIIDEEYYELQKFMYLLSNNNPNILELCFIPEKYWIQSSKLWHMIIEHKQKFLTKKIKITYLGYATSQIRRMKRHRAWLLKPPKKKPHRKDFGLERDVIKRPDLIRAFLSIPSEYVKENIRHDIIKELNYQNALREWQEYQTWKKNRNKKRYETEKKFGLDLKHCTHTMRLLYQGREILRDKTLIVDRREVDSKHLKEIRNGKWSYEQLMEEVEKIEKEINELYEKSTLPENVDLEFMNKLCMEITKEYHKI